MIFEFIKLNDESASKDTKIANFILNKFFNKIIIFFNLNFNMNIKMIIMNAAFTYILLN